MPCFVTDCKVMNKAKGFGAKSYMYIVFLCPLCVCLQVVYYNIEGLAGTKPMSVTIWPLASSSEFALIWDEYRLVLAHQKLTYLHVYFNVI